MHGAARGAPAALAPAQLLGARPVLAAAAHLGHPGAPWTLAWGRQPGGVAAAAVVQLAARQTAVARGEMVGGVAAAASFVAPVAVAAAAVIGAAVVSQTSVAVR